jgi:hypothetical protein
MKITKPLHTKRRRRDRAVSGCAGRANARRPSNPTAAGACSLAVFAHAAPGGPGSGAVLALGRERLRASRSALQLLPPWLCVLVAGGGDGPDWHCGTSLAPSA